MTVYEVKISNIWDEETDCFTGHSLCEAHDKSKAYIEETLIRLKKELSKDDTVDTRIIDEENDIIVSEDEFDSHFYFSLD
jgi:hypothetical protein